MVKALQEVDRENDYFLFCGRGLENFKEIKGEFEKDNFEVEQFSIPTNKWLEMLFLKDRIRIPLEVLRKKLDIFYSFDWPFPLLHLPRNCKFLVSMYGVNPYSLDIRAQKDFTEKIQERENYSLKRKIKNWMLDTNNYLYLSLLKKRIGEVSHIIVSSLNSKKDVVKAFNVPDYKISVIYEAIDSKVFKVVRDEKMIERVKRKYRINDPFIIFVSAIDWKKNITNVLEAFKIGNARFREPHQLVFVGYHLKQNGKPTNQFRFFRKRAKELRIENKVVFTGYVPDEDLALLYNAAQTHILPSFYEGFPLTIIEAMACGTPVIASYTSSIPEIIGNVEVYFDPYDTNNIAEAMIKICNDSDLRKKLADEGSKQVKKFSWEKSARQLAKVFEEMKDKTWN